MSLIASILSILLSFPKEREDDSLTGILCGGQILTRSVQELFEKRFNVPIFEGYGLTETTSFSCINGYPADKRKIGSIGKSLVTNEIMFRVDTLEMKKKIVMRLGMVGFIVEIMVDKIKMDISIFMEEKIL